MSTTDRKYTRLNYDEIIRDMEKILKSKSGPLADFSESSYGRTLLDIFSGTADLSATWIEQAFAESFLSSAQTKEAIYSGARSLGYSIRRPIPAKALYGMSLKRTGTYPTVRVHVSAGTLFSISGSVLTAVDDCEFVYRRADDTAQTGLMTLVNGRAVLIEGQFSYATYFSNGEQNQEYIVKNHSFSDYFGDGDPNYSEDDTFAKRSTRYTTVSSDASLVDGFDPEDSVDGKIYWRVSRRGFYDQANDTGESDIDSFIKGNNKSNNYTVLLETANDGNVRLSFSDGINAAIPYGTVTIKYFSTNGEDGNRLNVAGKTLEPSSNGILITQEDGSESDININDLNIGLLTDIRGGQNIESNESIKQNAPKVYATMDSLCTRESYIVFLKRYSGAKYATAFGEELLHRIACIARGLADNEYPRQVKYCNMVRYSMVRDLYRKKDNTYYPIDASEYHISGYKVNGLVYAWQYDYQELKDARNSYVNVKAFDDIVGSIEKAGVKIEDANGNAIEPGAFVKKFVSVGESDIAATIPTSVFTAQLAPSDFIETGSELEIIDKMLNRRGYVTLGGGYHVYTPPVVHEFTTKVDVTLYKGQNFNDIKTRIKNGIYEYLTDNTDFATPVFRSRLASIIQKMPEVMGVDLKIAPKENDYSNLSLANLTWLGNDTAEFIEQNYINMDGFSSKLTFDYVYGNADGGESVSTDNVFVLDVGDQTETKDAILGYYRTYIQASNGTTLPKESIRECDINNFVAFIWDRVMRNIYTPIYNAYKEELMTGSSARSSALYELIDAVKGWDMDDRSLSFKDTTVIRNLSEDSSNYLYNYLIYAIEYIKLVRNVLKYRSAYNMIDENGNISKYTGENEICQFRIDASDISVKVQTDNSLSS